MMEPAQDLPVAKQEERRRLFWSLYMLDRFLSCSRQHPHAILDRDCQVQLPSSEASFRRGIVQKTEILGNVGAGNEETNYRPGQFALLVLMGRTLGRCARYMLDSRQASKETLPWNPQSEYVAINSTLLCYECYLDTDISLNMESEADLEPAGHVIFSRMIFHLCHCLLNHPFLLRMRVDATNAKAPMTWYAAALKLGLRHAGHLSAIFGAAREAGFTASTTFYGYCLLIAGTIHVLHTHTHDPELLVETTEQVNSDLNHLDDIAKYWNNAGRIVSILFSWLVMLTNTASKVAALRAFSTIGPRFSALLNASPLPTPLSESDLQILWSMVDFGILSDSAKSLPEAGNADNALLRPELSPWSGELGGQATAPTMANGLILSETVDPDINLQSTGERFSTAPDNLSLDGLFSVFAESQSNEDFIGVSNPSYLSPRSNDIARDAQQAFASMQ